MKIEEKERLEKMMYYERECRNNGYKLIAGVDEVGRGPLAGPVVVASVILPEGIYIEGVNDSKKLSEKKREKLYDEIINKAISYNIEIIDNNIIDEINILEATRLAMKKAIEGLKVTPEYVLIDAETHVDVSIPIKGIIKGDALSTSIASASIIAKVTRDRMMVEYAKEYPKYGFEKHKGYGTKMHIDKIKEIGITPIHRKTFCKHFINFDD